MDKKSLIKKLLNKNIILKYQNDYYIYPNLDIKTMEESLGFEDVATKQRKNICKSRLDVNIKSEVINGVYLDVPLIAANMLSVVNSDFCIKLSKLGALGIMHRALDDVSLVKEIKNIAKECEWVAVSIGVGNNQFKLAKNLIKHGANIIVIDIAHGYSDIVFDLGKKIKKYYPNVKLVLGNTTNTDMLIESYKFADAIKVGIAQGFVCETKNTAGCTEKQFSAIYKFKYLSKKYGVPIISDGGIRECADFTKAIGAGANSIMAGKIFAACPESAARIVDTEHGKKKEYFGMSSRLAQDIWRNGLKKGTCPEGGVKYLDIGEPVDKLLERYSGALRSGITYCGAKDIKSFQNNVEFIKLK